MAFFSFILFALVAAPDFVEKLPVSDGVYKYYVGRSGPFSNERDAVNAATADAIEQATREFGFSTQINKETYESLQKTSSTARIKELSKEVQLKGFEQIKFHKESKKGSIEVWILFRYPLAEIQKEKRRLQEQKVEEKSIEFSTVGDSSTKISTIVEVISEPSATVLIDGEIYGKTPLRIINQITPGSHKIRFESDSFESVEEELIVPSNNPVKVRKVLIRSSGKLRINTNPPNALIGVNGQIVGNSPTDTITLPAGEKVSVQASHAESEKYSQEVDITKGEIRELNIDLPLKPSQLSLQTEPSGAMVELSGSFLQTPVQKHEIEPGTYEMRISKEGYLDRTEKITLRGGEHQILPTITLRSLTEEEIRLRDFPWVAGLDIGFGNSPISGVNLLTSRLSGSIEKRFYGFLGVRGSVGYIYGADGGGLKQNKKIQGWEFAGGVPFYYRNFFIGPEGGYLIGSYSEKIFETILIGTKQQIGTQESDFNSLFYGGFFGYEQWFSPHSKWGWKFQVSVRKYQSLDDLEGSWMFIGSGGLNYRF